ncbi:MAG: glycine cleavage system aminomethyltransferase GcvT [Acidimicrobiales bacterium]
MTNSSDLKKTLLHGLHVQNGAKFGPFAGYAMPLSYDGFGAIAEHLQTRRAASVFDVSHMRVVDLVGADPAASLETLVPGGITTLAEGKLRYTFFTNGQAGILDDLIAWAMADRVSVVVNASRVAHDLAHLRDLSGVEVRERDDLHLIAVQGPMAESVLTALGLPVTDLGFMGGIEATHEGTQIRITRSGYTGEDGFELALPSAVLLGLTEQILADDRAELSGLAARDSLRLEAGLCLYGSDIDETTTPLEAALMWAIPKRRRDAGDFPGAEFLAAQAVAGAARHRVGIGTDQRRPIRSGNELYDRTGNKVGVVTSGGFGATIDGPVAMGYVASTSQAVGTKLEADVRGKRVPCEVTAFPFVTPNYKR